MKDRCEILLWGMCFCSSCISSALLALMVLLVITQPRLFYGIMFLCPIAFWACDIDFVWSLKKLADSQFLIFLSDTQTKIESGCKFPLFVILYLERGFWHPSYQLSNHRTWHHVDTRSYEYNYWMRVVLLCSGDEAAGKSPILVLSLLLQYH